MSLQLTLFAAVSNIGEHMGSIITVHGKYAHIMLFGKLLFEDCATNNFSGQNNVFHNKN